MDICANDNTVFLSGELTAGTLNQEYCRRVYAAVGNGVNTIDLSRVGRADSACLSLLLALRRRHPQLNFSGLPEDVHKLAVLYETEHWIGAAVDKQAHTKSQ